MVYIGDSDFESLQPIAVSNSADIRFSAVDDDITLESNDRVNLIFTPEVPDLTDGLEGVGEYIRDTAVVNIIDNDRKNHFNQHLVGCILRIMASISVSCCSVLVRTNPLEQEFICVCYIHAVLFDLCSVGDKLRRNRLHNSGRFNSLRFINQSSVQDCSEVVHSLSLRCHCHQCRDGGFGVLYQR